MDWFLYGTSLGHERIKNELSPMITANVFTTILENHYNLRNYNGFRLAFARTVHHGTERIS